MKVIEMHSSWLAINSIHGCPNGCRYCLLKANDDNTARPRQIATPQEAVEQLLEDKYYDEKIPVCLLPNTDAFVTPSNIMYTLELLDELERKHLPNDLVLITKCRIPLEVIEKVKKMQQKQNIVFYISYSGLGKDIEPNIHEDILKDNFRVLKENDIPVIHYYRPFLPQNSDSKKIQSILDYVHPYTDISVTTGLALIDTFIDKIDCWDAIKENKEAALKANGVWPEKAWKFFNEEYHHEQQIFQTNTCALNTKLKRPSMQYYDTLECKNYNHCSEEQRKRCRLAHEKRNREEIIQRCKDLLLHLGFSLDKVGFVFDSYGSLELKNIDLKIRDASYLSYKLGVKVYISTNHIVKNIYNSTLNGARPLVLKEGNE